MNIKVSAIVVTFNRLKLLKICISHLLNQDYKLNNIVIVNNDSTDDTPQYLKKLSNNNDNIIVKNLKKNVGGAGGFSIGTQVAYEESDSEFFWLMDDDTMPTTSALSTLVDGIKALDGNFGFLCSNVRLPNNQVCNVADPDYYWNELLPGNLIRVEIGTFVSFLFSRKVVTKLGLPVGQMFIWGDDLEYSLRLYNYKPCYFVSNSIVIHNTKASSKPSLFNLSKNRQIFLKYDFRNKLYTAKKYGGFKGMMKQMIHMCSFMSKIPFKSHHDRLRILRYTLSGFILGFFFHPAVKFPRR